MPITWLKVTWSANQRITLYRKKHETCFYEWNGAFRTFGQIWVMSFRYPRWNPCTPSLHHMSPFENIAPKYHHQLFTISFHESTWFHFLPGAVKNVLSRRFSPFWPRVGRVTRTKQLVCHGLRTKILHAQCKLTAQNQSCLNMCRHAGGKSNTEAHTF